jgi:hypothetical protein
MIHLKIGGEQLEHSAEISRRYGNSKFIFQIIASSELSLEYTIIIQLLLFYINLFNFG